jgi:hypothetical protein
MWDWGMGGNMYGNMDTGTFGETFGNMPMSRGRGNRQFANGNPYMNAAGQMRQRFSAPTAMQHWAQRGAAGNMAPAGWGQNTSWNQSQADEANHFRQRAYGAYQSNPAQYQQMQYQPMQPQGAPYMGDMQNYQGY